MAKRRIDTAKPKIFDYFEALPDKIHRVGDLQRIFASQRGTWNLSQATTGAEFIRFLQAEGQLRELRFPFPHRGEVRYVWGTVPLLEVIGTLKADGYFCHYSAVRLHGLTEQLPKTIYLNHEQRPHVPSGTLEQRAIDQAFKSKPRVSNNAIDFGDVRVYLLNGMHTGQLGVVSMEADYDGSGPARVRVTNLERTLIDIAVRPFYAGGVAEVLKAFESARGRASANRLVALLRRLNYVYPYHQAIGFYMERAGYSDTALGLLRELPRDFDFYLANQMRETDYVPGWRLHVPKGF